MAQSVEDAGPQDSAIAFVGVNVVPMDSERVLEDLTVVVSGDRITEIGAASRVAVPEGTQIVSGEGRFLIPGLADMHYHLSEEERALSLALANGITTVQAFNATLVELGWSDEIAAGERLGPSIIGGPHALGLPPDAEFVLGRLDGAIGPLLSTGKFVASNRSGGWETFQLDADSGRDFVRRARKAGAAFIKTNLFVGREAFDAIVDEATFLGMKVQGHIWGDIGLEHYIGSGAHAHHVSEVFPFLSSDATQGVPLQEYDFARMDEQLPRLIDLIMDNEMWFTPTVSPGWYLRENYRDLDGLLNRDRNRYAPPADVAAWADPETNFVYIVFGPDGAGHAQRYVENQERVVRAAHEAGLPILAGTDGGAAPGSVVGFDLHLEIELLADYGLSNFEALATATRLPAEFWDEADVWGTIGPGKRADMVLLGGNPLDDVSNTSDIHGVMVRGRWLGREELDAMLDEIASGFEALGSISMEPFTSEPFGLTGVAPAGWTVVDEGVWTRSDPDTDPTFLVQRSVSAADAEAALNEMLGEFGAAVRGPIVDEFVIEGIAWSLYLPEGELAIAMATGEIGSTTLNILLATQPGESEFLRESVLKPAVANLRPV